MNVTFQRGGLPMKAILTCAMLALAITTAGAQAAQPTSLTLACTGTVMTGDGTTADGTTESVSMGVIVNFSAGTVRGFTSPGQFDIPTKITGLNDTTVVFQGSARDEMIIGDIDRVTGDAEATYSIGLSRQTVRTTKYSLRCRPAQRLF
jgi:hypothetical protein